MATGTREKYTEHPSIAVIGGKPHLRVFEDFFVEEDLPKWRKIKVEIDEEDKKSGDNESYDVGASWGNNASITGRRSKRNLLRSAKGDRRSYVQHGREILSVKDAVTDTNEKKKSWFRRLCDKFCGIGKGEPVEKVFNDVKTDMMSPSNEEILKAKKIVETVEKTLRASGQYEIADKVNGNRSVLEAEVALVSSGNLKYISEEQIIKFMLKSERGVRLEFLRYYPNIMPKEVAQKKIVFDGLLVFDNYCVLYFDNSATKFSLVKESLDDEERRKRRDPILFGMINGSRKLYYVADWITEDDDLTLEKLETVIGEKALDLGKEKLMGTEESVSQLLDRMIVNIQVESDDLAEKGLLITEENFEEFVMNGTAPVPLEKNLREMGIKPMRERIQEQNKKKKRRHHHKRHGDGGNK